MDSPPNTTAALYSMLRWAPQLTMLDGPWRPILKAIQRILARNDTSLTTLIDAEITAHGQRVGVGPAPPRHSLTEHDSFGGSDY